MEPDFTWAHGIHMHKTKNKISESSDHALLSEQSQPMQGFALAHALEHLLLIMNSVQPQLARELQKCLEHQYSRHDVSFAGFGWATQSLSHCCLVR